MISEDIKKIVPKAKSEWVTALLAEMESAGINTPLRQCAFLAQVTHESLGLTRFEENLNYSADGLMKTFKKKFPTLELAQKYARHPEMIANYVYAGRYGNGDEASGDGWRFHGRSPIQLTFSDNYKKCGEETGLKIFDNPDLALTPSNGSKIACWFWNDKDLNVLADAGKFDAITFKINGGYNGKEERTKLFTAFKQVCGI